MSRRSRERVRRLREARERDAAEGAAFSSIRLAGFGAAFLVFIAVAIGFRGEALNAAVARRFRALEGLLEPGLFGISLLEWIAFALALALTGVALWRGLRR